MTTLATPALRLDADHRYWLADRELISVTAALKEAGLIDTAFFTEDAADRGTYVHEACGLVDERDLGSVDPACAGYVAAYERFVADAKPKWCYAEHGVCDVLHGYAGTLDRAGWLNGKWTVLDIKTGPACPWHGLQLAAYARLVRDDDGGKPLRFDLYLTPDGAYRLEPQTHRADEALFFAALAVAQFRRTHGYRRD
jgi:hypothetical protein